MWWLVRLPCQKFAGVQLRIILGGFSHQQKTRRLTPSPFSPYTYYKHFLLNSTPIFNMYVLYNQNSWPFSNIVWKAPSILPNFSKGKGKILSLEDLASLPPFPQFKICGCTPASLSISAWRGYNAILRLAHPATNPSKSFTTQTLCRDLWVADWWCRENWEGVHLPIKKWMAVGSYIVAEVKNPTLLNDCASMAAKVLISVCWHKKTRLLSDSLLYLSIALKNCFEFSKSSPHHSTVNQQPSGADPGF